MSDINGNGHGASHDWYKGDTTAGPFEDRRTVYVCKNCQQVFQHYYHVTPDIFLAMFKDGVPDVCPNQPTV